MKRIAPLWLPATLLLALPVSAQVYRGIGPDGRPFYSDRPIPDGTAVELPGVKPTAPADADQPPTDADKADQALGFRGSYDEFEMLSPTEGVTIRDLEGRLKISLLLAPALKEGQRVAVQVDGVAAGGEGTGLQLELKGLALGSHRVQALVVDDAGVPVAATATVNVHVRPPLPEGAMPR